MGEGREHRYTTTVDWTGNLGTGTSGYRAFSRDHDIGAPDKPTIAGSSDPAFRGDRTRYNPEDMLVASLSACHMLWYLHLCSRDGIVVTGYRDTADGTMVETADGGGHFSRVTLAPHVTLAAGCDEERARKLHDEAHHLCFIANSVNFPVEVAPTFAMTA